MSALYEHPRYYEIAYSYRDIPAEVDVFQECFRRFSKIPVKTILELGCGYSPHMPELIRRGYNYCGLDLSQPMLEYSRQIAAQLHAKVKFIHGDLVQFQPSGKVDFAFITLDTLCVKNFQELCTHFDSVASVLKRGGLYLLEWCINFDESQEGEIAWLRVKDGVHVKTTVRWENIDPAEQLEANSIEMDVEDKGRHEVLQDRSIRHAISPREFLGLIHQSGKFKFVGWWNDWDLEQPLGWANGKIARPITVVRRI
jgi:SAM-dependent methyltransferase